MTLSIGNLKLQSAKICDLILLFAMWIYQHGSKGHIMSQSKGVCYIDSLLCLPRKDFHKTTTKQTTKQSLFYTEYLCALEEKILLQHLIKMLIVLYQKMIKSRLVH